MKSLKHILLLSATFFTIFSAQAQIVLPPSTGGESIKFFANNGILDLKELNPAQIVQEKSRRTLEQVWSNNNWLSDYQEQTRFSGNCVAPTFKTFENYAPATGRWLPEALDTFIYTNNRLTSIVKFEITSDGVRTLNSTKRFFYPNTTTLLPDSTRETEPNGDYIAYKYSYDANNRITNIVEYLQFAGFPTPLVSRVVLTYDARGNLSTFKEEDAVTPNNWSLSSLNTYTYNAQNQMTKVKSVSYSNGVARDSIAEVYTYNATNQMTRCVFVEDADSILVINVKNRNAQKRPQLLEATDLSTSDRINILATYQANDTLIKQYIGQVFDPATNTFVNANRLIFEYCGDAVATKDVQKAAIPLQVFPNPANEVLNLKIDSSDKTVNLSISNLAGQVVLQAQNYAADTPLSISSLSSGLYVLKVQSSDKVGVKTFSIVR